ncbi:MAG: SdrD B-like domain-containing protein [Actinomycetia bacterium]|nr:SdrD B-like domain-containing protein [Actinomycetes bacterium]
MRALVLVTGLVLGVVAFAMPVPARAAEVPGAFKNIKVTAASGSGPIYPWEQVRVTADWTVPDRTPAGSTFTMAWPTDKMKGNTGSLALKNPDGDVVANCTLSAGGVSCTLTDFVATHPFDIGGKVWFALNQVNAEERSTVEVPFTIGRETVKITYKTDGSVPFEGLQLWKDGGVYPGGADWYLYFPGGTTGQSQDYHNVVVDDTVGAGQSIVPGSFVLQHATRLDPAGAWPVWEDAPSSLFTVNLDQARKSFQFKAPLLAKGGWWRLTYKVTVMDGYVGDITNTMTAKWDGRQSQTVSRTESYFNNGGSGAGTMKAVSVGDTVWFDSNRNGLQDEGAGSGISGAVLTLTGPDGQPVTNVFGKPVAPITTGPTGTYLFENLPLLPAGQHYTVSVKAPDGYVPTTEHVGGDREKDSSTGSATSTDLTTNGAKDLSLDFGFVKEPINLVLAKSVDASGPVKAGDQVTYTLQPSNDSKQEAMKGWSVTDLLPAGTQIVSMSGDGYTCDITTAPTKPVCTSNVPLAAGAKAAPITAVVKVVATSGSLKNVAYVAPAPGDVPETNPLDVPTLDTDTATSRTDNDAQATINVAEIPVSIGDYVWWDANRDGIQQPGEKPAGGVTMTLEDASGKTVQTTKTNESGYYSFTGLKPGTDYVLVFQKPDGATFTIDNAGGDDAADSDVPANGRVAVKTPVTGANDAAPGKTDLPTLDAGLVQINLTLSKKLITNAPYTTATQVSFLLVPHNVGPSDAIAGWSVTDIPQAGLTLVSISGEGYSCTGLTCTSSQALAAGADGKPIVATFQLPSTTTYPVTYRNVAYVSPAKGETPETNPLVVPTIDTDTAKSATDNDSEASLTLTNYGEVAPPSQPNDPSDPAPLPNTGSDMPLGALVGGLLAVIGGGALVLQSVRRRAQQ